MAQKINKPKAGRKIAVAMSGGVDSSVVAKMLKDESHDIVGLFLKLWSDPSSCSARRENRCCDWEALEDARKVANMLNIPFYVINAEVEFKKEVVDYFLAEYRALRTPNPCIVCNDKIKFDLLLKKALSIGCDKLATGHYAIIKSKIKDQTSKLKNYYLCKGIDNSKDQSYMLYLLGQNQLLKVLFPLGNMMKKDVRALAMKWKLPVQEKPESQEICFFADRDYRPFLKRHLNKKYFQPGEIVDIEGNVIGKHGGLLNYTIGQRKLIDQKSKVKNQNDGVNIKNDKNPLYVIKFDRKRNRLIVGDDGSVYQKEMTLGNLHFIHDSEFIIHNSDLNVKIRYRHPDFPCKVKKVGGKLEVVFAKSERAVTPGQSAVFYAGDEVLGGGIIESK